MSTATTPRHHTRPDCRLTITAGCGRSIVRLIDRCDQLDLDLIWRRTPDLTRTAVADIPGMRCEDQLDLEALADIARHVGVSVRLDLIDPETGEQTYTETLV